MGARGEHLPQPTLVTETDRPETETGSTSGRETMLVTTDSLEEFATEMSSSFTGRPDAGSIQQIQGHLLNGDETVPSAESATAPVQVGSARDRAQDINLSAALSSVSLEAVEDSSTDTEDYLHNPEWLGKDKHVFILSSAGKPIYSRYGNEDKLAGLCGVIQALVSVVNNSAMDTIRSIHTPSCLVVFLIKGPLILAAVSKLTDSETQLVLQLTYVFNQIVSVLTLTQLTRIFEQRRNYDLRRLLSGAERLIDHLLNFMEKDPSFLLGAVRCLPLAPSMRDNITNAIVSACSKIKDLVFAILIAGNQLVTLVRMKKYTLHPSDIHLVLNLVKSSESFKSAESWTPICLPKFDSSGFLHGHVSYLSDDCQACLLLLTVQRDAFFPLSQAKQTITEKLRRTNCLEAINDAVSGKKDLSTSKPLRHLGVPELRHFIYKCRTTAQLFTSDPVDSRSHRASQDDLDSDSVKVEPTKGKISSNKINLPNFLCADADSASIENCKLPDTNYLDAYRKVCGQMHRSARPVNLIYRLNSQSTILSWVSVGFELYMTFDPLVDKITAIGAVDRLLKWIKKEEDKIFITNAPTF
ncbi:vacuolar fusion protein MON1 homolog [Arctopsyche grandis]|uniref:vacuolar fusion protein MON1 homolog n=1 Tax=Arctopsyche grandis TaxID=121162 RepID=UPI00406D72E9